MKPRTYIFCVVLLIITFCIGSCRKAGYWLVKEDVQAADLYKQEAVDKVIIVEESMGAFKVLEERGVNIISNTNQVHDAIITLGIPADSIIILPGDAASTQMEATIIREYLIEKPELDTLLIVSSVEHMRRAFMIFKTAFRKAGMPVTVLCSPSAYSSFDPKNWWKSKEGMQIVFLEYTKMAVFVLFESRKLGVN
jgi:uncharacterized SAM-binding protein YcdF (DUF218 family)